MFKKNLFILLATFMMFSNIGGSSAETKDVLEQINNYFMFGNPHRTSGNGGTTKIFNRKECRMGMEFDDGDYLILNWDNVVTDEIDVQEKWIKQNVVPVLSLSGNKPVVYTQFTNPIRALGYMQIGIPSGKHTILNLPLPGLKVDRIKKALEILFGTYCKGIRRKSAF